MKHGAIAILGVLMAAASAQAAPVAIETVPVGNPGNTGDPIEFQSLTQLFRRRSDKEPPVYVTSVKANIGHTETVSGIAGLVKTVLLLQHGVIPGQLHLECLNPHIQLDGTRLVIDLFPSP